MHLNITKNWSFNLKFELKKLQIIFLEIWIKLQVRIKSTFVFEKNFK